LISSGKLRTLPQNANPFIDQIAAFPIGLSYISAAMKKAGFKVITLNSCYISLPLEKILEEAISKYSIDVVGLSGTSLDVQEITQMIRTIRGINANAKIVVGGAVISADPFTAMKVLGGDIGVIGEGEDTMCELAHALNNDSFVGDVPGIIYWKNGELKRSPNRSEITKLDDIPFMDFEGFNYSQWLAVNNYAGIIHSARSCPFKCTFCFKSTGNRYRQRSLDSIFKEIDYQIGKYHIRSIMLTDELFASNKKRVYEFCDRIRQYHMNWGASLRVPEIEPELLRLMKHSGCNGISTGLESGSDEILTSMRKGATAKQVENALHVFASSELSILGNFIFGDVGETKETMDRTIELWKKYNQRVYINLGIVATYPGTTLYEQAVRNGLISDKEKYLKEGRFYLNMTKMSDAEYFHMVSRITELGFLPQVPAKSVAVREVTQDEFCEVEWHCRNCDRSHMMTRAHFLQAHLCHCTCGTPNVVEPFRDVLHNGAELLALLPREGLIAYWGAGSQYCRIARFYDCFHCERFIQVDANQYYQQLTRLGKKIYDPSIIGQEKISCVVITSPLAKESILKSIREEYPTVERVFYPKLLSFDGRFIPSFQPVRI
jgi:radical SAM superfamily enzyme YgiQ (UPF0313 family)